LAALDLHLKQGNAEQAGQRHVIMPFAGLAMHFSGCMQSGLLVHSWYSTSVRFTESRLACQAADVNSRSHNRRGSTWLLHWSQAQALTAAATRLEHINTSLIPTKLTMALEAPIELFDGAKW
jgi:hypothetical protein